MTQSAAASILDSTVPTEAVAAAAPEATATPTATSPTPAAANTEKLSPKLHGLLQREKSALQREQAVKAREAEISEKLARLEQFESAKGTSPLEALKLLGYSYEDLTKATLADGNLPADVQVKKVEEKLNSFLEGQEKAALTAAQKEKEDAVRQEQEMTETFQGEIATFLKENADRYEFIAFEEEQQLVYDVIDEHYKRTQADKTAKAEAGGFDVSDIRGDVMTIADASDKVEQWLEQRDIKRKELKKSKALWAMRPNTAQAASTASKPTNKPTSQKPKTLTNNMSAIAGAPRTKPISDDERVQKAIAFANSLLRR